MNRESDTYDNTGDAHNQKDDGFHLDFSFQPLKWFDKMAGKFTNWGSLREIRRLYTAGLYS